MIAKDVTEKLKSLEVFVTDGDIRIYHKYMNLLSKDARVIDLGTGWGKSVIAMALCCDNKIPIDTYDDGSYPIAMKWSTDDNYIDELCNQFKKYGAENIFINQCNLLSDNAFWDGKQYDLLHLDIMQEAERQILNKWLPSLKPGGIALVRNYKRFKDEADEILKGYEYLDYDGLIQVVRKPL